MLRRLVVVFALTAACGFGAVSPALAGPVRIPLHIDYIELTEALRHQVYSNGGRARLWSGTDECQYLYAQNPRVSHRGPALLIDTDGNLALGVAVGGNCVSPVTWSGIIELDVQPFVRGYALKFHVTDVNLYDQKHQKSGLVGRDFDLIKGNIIPTLENFSYDLGPAIKEFESLAGMAAGPAQAAALHSALATLKLEYAVGVEDTGVRLMLDMAVPDAAPTPVPTGPAAPLKPEEVAAWKANLNDWDAFMVFAIKQIGATVQNPEVRSQLLDVLLDGRERLVAALAQPQAGQGPDPVRLLFLDEWTRLRQIIETAAGKGMLGNRALEFLSFISAGDALFAIDQAAPALGMRISADDLRRLARIMAPNDNANPLTYSFDEDPDLQKLFGIGTPLESEGPIQSDDEAGPTTSPEASPSPTSTATPLSGSVSMLSMLLDAVGPGRACAAETVHAAPELFELGRKLREVVVNDSNATSYRSEMDKLLTFVAHGTMTAGGDPSQRFYLTLVKSVAWQESCWRQFTIRRNRVMYIESSTGDIGLMQVNKYVWRGLYSLKRLKWDVIYNASAGSQILSRLIAGVSQHEKAGANPDDLARSVYAAYNGGPTAYGRWRHANEPETVRAIDSAFWAKYKAMREGQSFDIVRCAAEWDKTHAN